ncbi:MAG TPA: radical SAM protein [Acidobacteriota bacterium]|nr:radical SAM protein [Acidobacteriota bacterium]
MQVTRTTVKNILTRASGYLKEVCSHSLQPYRGCTLGNSLCGVGCYVRHNQWVTRGRPWGSFLEVRENAAASYLERYAAERRWARRLRGGLSIFLSSATEPFLPQEKRYGITGEVLRAMLQSPPDELILQTHSHRVGDHLELLHQLAQATSLRVHISIESDRDRLPGLPPPASSVEKRFEAARRLKQGGLFTVVTVSPMLPVREPEVFFQRIADCAQAVVLDHFIGGDGTPDGRRTRATGLPEAMEKVDPECLNLDYRDRMAEVARRYLPGRVGIGASGFAGRYEG